MCISSIKLNLIHQVHPLIPFAHPLTLRLLCLDLGLDNEHGQYVGHGHRSPTRLERQPAHTRLYVNQESDGLQRRVRNLSPISFWSLFYFFVWL